MYVENIKSFGSKNINDNLHTFTLLTLGSLNMPTLTNQLHTLIYIHHENIVIYKD